MYALVNCDVYTGDSVEYDKAVVVDGAKVIDLVDYEALDSSIERTDLRGLSVAPGFIDLQVNGGGGILFNDQPSPAGIKAIVAAHRRFGTTSLLPTFITGTREGMHAAVSAVQEVIDTSLFKSVLGMHFEGPFIEPSKAGVHDKKFIRPPSEADIAVVTSLKRGAVLLTLAPEVVPLDLITRLRQLGVIVSLGHSNASAAQAHDAFAAGARCVTHLYNAMSALNSREPGLVGAALVDDDSYAGIIVDGHHADFVSVQVAVRAKARRKLVLVTDAMPPVGLGDSGTPFHLSGYDVRVEGGKCVTGEGVLAGSALDMATAVRNCIQKVGIPKDEALRMASTYPAEFLRLEDKLGRIAPGFDADLVIFNNQLVVSAVVIGGVLQEMM